MCTSFIGKHNHQVKVATEDMTVFKVVNLDLKKGMWRGIYVTTYTAPLNTEIKATGHYTSIASGNLLEIGEGMFHSCADLATIWARRDYRVRHYIVKCVIPKGTKYLASKVSNDICSEKLIVTDTIIAGNGIDCPFIDTRMLEEAEVSICSKNNETYIHIKDESHEVYLSLKNTNNCSWRDAIGRCRVLGGVLPNTDDWDLIDKYRHQIDPLIKKLQGDSLYSEFWSSSEYCGSTAWLYCGYSGRFSHLAKWYGFKCRPVLALET